MGDLPATMDAAVVGGPGRLSVEQRPVPVPGPGEVLAAVDLCGVCGTDLHLVLEGWARPGTVPGHEWVGTVVAVGAGVVAWTPGDAVVGGPPAGCQTCTMCRQGRTSLCTDRPAPGSGAGMGAFAGFTVVPEAELLPVPAGLDPRAAALVEPLAVAQHALAQGGVVPGTRLLVMGAGPIGALAVAAARADGVEGIACVEPGERRRALAAAVGADRVVAPGELDVPSIAEPGRIVDGAVDVVLECSGRAAAMEAGLAQLGPGGVLVLVGSGMDQPRFDPNRIVLNELTVTGAFNYEPDGFHHALGLLATGALPVDDLLEPDVVGLDGLLDALHGLSDGRLAGKVLVRP